MPPVPCTTCDSEGEGPPPRLSSATDDAVFLTAGIVMGGRHGCVSGQLEGWI